MAKETITIDALELDDETLDLLARARYFGYLVGKKVLNELADGGAQLILFWGREFISENFPDGVLFELTEAEKADLDALLNDEEIKALPNY